MSAQVVIRIRRLPVRRLRRFIRSASMMKGLKEMAGASGGNYINARSHEDLTTEFKQTADMRRFGYSVMMIL
ncbi:MAG: hypothetical protein ACQEWI_07650 [Bacillota bacterium]